MEAGKPLANLVGRIQQAITWTIKTGGKGVAAGASGPHTLYVTYGRPIDTGLVEDGVTERRMEKAIEWVEPTWSRGKKEPVDLIEAVFSKFSSYILNLEMLPVEQRSYLLGNPAVMTALMDAGFATYMKNDKGGPWPLAEYVRYGGECQAIVRLTRAIAHQVGLPGTLGIKYVSSEPADPTKTRILDDPSVDPDGPMLGYTYALVDAEVVVGREYGVQDGVGFNRYEAFLKYTDPANTVTWFGGGIGRIDSHIRAEDLVRVFWGLAATSAGGPESREPGLCQV